MINKLINVIRHEPVFSNVAEGTHAGQVTRMLESDITTRHLLGKIGSASTQVDLADAGDAPLGVITDCGEAGDYVNVSLPGSVDSTLLMIASEAISAGEDVYTAASGKVQDRPLVAGTYYQIGRALTDAAGDGDVLEVEPVSPRKTVVMDAFSGSSIVDFLALSTTYEKAPDKIIMLSE
ncbi:capsid cement protein [Rubellicoccus peritrichatus]|uniref:DUF2190 family protein n=1 Tax=Rubellicoccus peritrichatus TaxID=3080537 RepID=A0AAQ3LBB8_9BACT|nr:capsid cement protein [Puniceicoccus sp. CR14]WOO41167.1 DUF2190 family protein [Puniceicoccus sp. CR14]